MQGDDEIANLDRLERRIEDLQADLVIANTKAEKAERNAARAVGAFPLVRWLSLMPVAAFTSMRP